MTGKGVFLVCLLLATASCGTRGETHTLTQVFQDAQHDFRDALNNTGDQALKNELTNLAGILDNLVGDDAKNVSANADRVSTELSRLTFAAGYTSRPGLTELINQFRALADKNLDSAGDKVPQLKLLVARSYLTLAGELKGIGFKLRERELRS